MPGGRGLPGHVRGLLALTGFALGAQTHLNMPFGGGSAVAAETPMVNVEVAADEGTATESWVQVPAFSRIEVELDMGNVSVMPTGGVRPLLQRRARHPAGL